MRLQRATLLALTLALASVPLVALDWGGYVDNTTGIASAPPGADGNALLVQQSSVGLWLQQGLGSWELDAEGSYTFTLEFPLLLNLDVLTLGTDVIAQSAGATTFGVEFGRSPLADSTGYVLNATVDGVRLAIAQQQRSFAAAVGTTALIQLPANQIVVGTLDENELAAFDPENIDSLSELFAPPKLVGTFEYRLLEALAGQHLTVAATINEDLRPEEELTAVGTELSDPQAGGRFDTQYLSLGLSGAIAPNLFQRFYYTLNSGRELEFVEDENSATGESYQYVNFLGHMAGLELTYFLPELLNSRARLFTQFSTGESDWSGEFIPLSPSTFSDVFSLEPGNSSHIGVSYSARPLAAIGLDILQAELRTVAYLRTSGSGEVSEPAVDPASDGTYVGTDINLILTAVPFSDLRVVVKAGLFAPNGDVMSAGNETVDYQVTLQGILRY